MPVRPPPAGEMTHRLGVMRRPKLEGQQGAPPNKWPEHKQIWAAFRTIGAAKYEQLRKQFGQATGVFEVHYDRDLKTSDVLWDMRRQKRFEIAGLVDVDNEGVLHRIPVVELVA